jgi:hypothetical protein
MVASQESKKKGIPIFTIAIGGTTNEILSYMDPYTSKRVTLLDETGAPLRSDIDETLLKSISETTGGAYYRVTGARELYDYWDRISARLGNNTETSIQTAFVSYRPYLLLALIILILIERIATTQIFYKKGR